MSTSSVLAQEEGAVKVVTLGRCACGAVLKRREENSNVVYQSWWDVPESSPIGHAHEVMP